MDRRAQAYAAEMAELRRRAPELRSVVDAVRAVLGKGPLYEADEILTDELRFHRHLDRWMGDGCRWVPRVSAHHSRVGLS